MHESCTKPSPFLAFGRFLFHLEVTGLMVLPPYKGAVFHGALGNSFRRALCADRGGKCSVCLVRHRCRYKAIFDTQPLPDLPDAGKYVQAPRPYVLNPPLTNKQIFHIGDSLSFELVLIGEAIEALPYWVYAAIEAGRRGVGRERGRYRLTSVEQLEIDGKCEVLKKPIYDGATQTLRSFHESWGPTSYPADDNATSVTLRLITPLRLKVRGELATDFSFPLFFERLTHRLALLAKFFGCRSTVADFPELLDRSHQLSTQCEDLHWYDWERYSGRQKDVMRLGGIKGKITVNGQLSAFMPVLRLGEHMHVGQGTTFGLGGYQISGQP